MGDVVYLEDYRKHKARLRTKDACNLMRARGLDDEDFLHAMRDQDSPPLEEAEEGDEE